MDLENEYNYLRGKVQCILKTGTQVHILTSFFAFCARHATRFISNGAVSYPQAWGEASTFAEMNTTSLHQILDIFFPSNASGVVDEPVVLDIGSGLGNLPFRAAIQYGAKAIGVEFNRELHLQTNRLLQELLRHSSFSPVYYE